MIEDTKEEIKQFHHDNPQMVETYNAYYQAGYRAALAEMMKHIMYLQSKEVKAPDLKRA